MTILIHEDYIKVEKPLGEKFLQLSEIKPRVWVKNGSTPIEVTPICKKEVDSEWKYYTLQNTHNYYDNGNCRGTCSEKIQELTLEMKEELMRMGYTVQ